MIRVPLTSLARLDLFATHIGPWGAEAIGTRLATADVPVRELWLADNAIEDRGLKALATALRDCPAFAARITSASALCFSGRYMK